MSIIKRKFTDHQLAKIIKDHDMKLRKDSLVNYYHNDNFTMEILIVFDNANNSKTIYSTF